MRKKADYCHFQSDKDSIGFRADENPLVNKTKVASREGDRWIRVTCHSNWILLKHLFLYYEKKGRNGEGRGKGNRAEGWRGRDAGREGDDRRGERVKNWSVNISVSKNSLKGISQTFYFVIITINLKARKGILLYKL